MCHHQVANLKKAIKATSSQEVDDQHMSDSREMEAQPIKPAKKTSKIKGWVMMSVRFKWKKIYFQAYIVVTFIFPISAFINNYAW